MQKKLADYLINKLFPPKCLSCNSLVATHGGICHHCWPKLQFISSPACSHCNFPLEYAEAHNDNILCGECIQSTPLYDKAKTVLIYEIYSAKLISNLKYTDKTYGARTFAAWMAKECEDILAHADMIVPVPIHRKRLLQRKYNQSALLAKHLAKKSQNVFAPLVLVRKKHTPPQASLNMIERKKNVQGCFTISPRYAEKIQGKSIVLIDDVITTGATIEECTKILKKAGSGNVSVITLAKTIKR